MESRNILFVCLLKTWNPWEINRPKKRSWWCKEVRAPSVPSTGHREDSRWQEESSWTRKMLSMSFLEERSKLNIIQWEEAWKSPRGLEEPSKHTGHRGAGLRVRKMDPAEYLVTSVLSLSRNTEQHWNRKTGNEPWGDWRPKSRWRESAWDYWEGLYILSNAEPEFKELESMIT